MSDERGQVKMKKTVFVVCAIFLVFGLAGCLSQSDTTSSESDMGQTQPQEVVQEEPRALTLDEQRAKMEEQAKKDTQLLMDRKNANGALSIADYDEILKIRSTSGAEAQKFLASAEPGSVFYFKIRALYKGFDKENGKMYLEDVDPAVSTQDTFLSMAFGVDTTAYTIQKSDEPTEVTEPNTLATFYCYGFRLTDQGQSVTTLQSYPNFAMDANSVVVLFDKTKFTVASGMSYISVYDVSTPTQKDVMTSFITGGAMGNKSANIFDPIKYKPADLMDARVAMDKKDIRNNFTFPTVKVKYVSEVLFKGQSGTTITVSTDDNVLTERLNFTGRASAIRAGEKVKVYYTIAKDPLEEWELQAIERL